MGPDSMSPESGPQYLLIIYHIQNSGPYNRPTRIQGAQNKRTIRKALRLTEVLGILLSCGAPIDGPRFGTP